MIRLLALLLLFVAAPAVAQDFPALSGRVVDAANLIPPDREAALTARLEALEQASTRQLVVATVPDLQGRSVEEYGSALGRSWGIGKSEANNGIILLVAPSERKVRIEVGYGLEGIVTDALAGRIIRNDILPRFRDDDYPGGIEAGVDALIEQLQAPPELAEQRALEAAEAEASGGGGDSFIPLLFWILVLVFVIVPMLRNGFSGRRYRGRRRRRGGPIVIWGPGLGSGGGGWGSSGGGWGGGSSGGSFGGFSGGGGSFGGGGASGGW